MASEPDDRRTALLSELAACIVGDVTLVDLRLTRYSLTGILVTERRTAQSGLRPFDQRDWVIDTERGNDAEATK